MPASLDPTTVSSLAHAQAVRSTSPRGSVQWNKNGVSGTWIPPQSTSISSSSGRLSQPASQDTFSAAPTPNSTSTRSAQVNYETLSPSTSFPPAIQAHPSPLVPSVSPSATFSKLSLHSPDASSSPHLSILSASNESTPLSSASASTSRPSDHRPSSPHRPSKPLHVHPQNESPSFLTSISVPVVTSSDGTRDTPAEAQYQQPYRSSPETRQETSPLSDAEKRRPTNGEAYRVRFASPEILSGMPRLRGRATSESSEPPAPCDGVSINADALLAAKEQKVPPDCDAMEVDIGDNQRQDGSGPSHATSHESGMNDVSEDKRSSLAVPGSPRPQAPPDSRLHSILSAEVGPTPEIDSSPAEPDVNEMTSQAEPMAVDPEPAQPPREPSPPPPPKVKMSLKDFALRKKKQREEEMAAKALGSPATPDGPALPSSPSVDVKRDLPSEHAGAVQTPDSVAAVNGREISDATEGDDAPDLSGAAHTTLNGLDGSGVHGRNAVYDPRLTEEEAMAEDNKPSAEAHAPSPIVATKVPDTLQSSPQHPAPSSPISSRVSGEKNNTDQTRTPVAGKPPMTLTAKMEILDAMVPSGLISADDPTPNVVSLAPEPPPPPLTTKQTSETTTVDHTAPVGFIPRSAAPSIPAYTSTPSSMSTSTSTSAVTSRANSVGIPHTPIPTSNPLPHAHVPSSSSSVPYSRRPSHEDGEITSSTPPKTFLPRSHTPPTQPRSFHAVHPSSPNLGPTSSSTTPVLRRPALPPSRPQLSNNPSPAPTPISISSRPLPSGPRALRGSMSQPTHPYPPTRPPYTGSQYIPRGPSADRDRMDWDRSDRQWPPQTRPRGRTGSNGWGR